MFHFLNLVNLFYLDLNSPRKIQCRIVSHSNVTRSRSDRGMTIHQFDEIDWFSDNLSITCCFSSSVILVHSTISSNVLPQPSQMLVEVFKEQFFVQGLIDTDNTLWGFFRSLNLQSPWCDSPSYKKNPKENDLNSKNHFDWFRFPCLKNEVINQIICLY